jgi:hypothetical protein
MNRAMLSRLAALEGATCGNPMPVFVVRFIVDANGPQPEPETCEDGRGNVWRREPGEHVEAFCDRAAAGALAASPPKCCATLFVCDVAA